MNEPKKTHILRSYMDEKFKLYVEMAYDGRELPEHQLKEIRRAFMAGIHQCACLARDNPIEETLKRTLEFAQEVASGKN